MCFKVVIIVQFRMQYFTRKPKNLFSRRIEAIFGMLSRRAVCQRQLDILVSKEDKIFIKNLQQLKGYTATRFLTEFRTKNWTRA